MGRVLTELRAALREVADAERAPQMQRYMKSAMPFHGVASAPARAVFRRVLGAVPLPDAETWRARMLELWRGATHREERYGALWLAGDRRARTFQDMDALPAYEEMIVTGAWWDYVDDIASHRIGELLRRYPKPMRKTMLAWSRDDDMWKRRTAIICQLGFKEDTDLDLLYRCIEPSLASTEFFLRKAIGWALRQYAWTDPDEVIRWVEQHEARLSGLSRREALKNVGRR
jgi:3-methyladenine DNA glycosylase AlkD